MLGREWTPEEIWSIIQFYTLLCDWNLSFAVCPLLLSFYLAWICACKGIRKNGTTTWGIELEHIVLLRIVNHTGESAIVYSRTCPRLYVHIGMKVTSDREDFHVEMYILIILVLFRPYGRGEKLGNKWNNIPPVTIF